jgi:hypothetical protein
MIDNTDWRLGRTGDAKVGMDDYFDTMKYDDDKRAYMKRLLMRLTPSQATTDHAALRERVIKYQATVKRRNGRDTKADGPWGVKTQAMRVPDKDSHVTDRLLLYSVTIFPFILSTQFRVRLSSFFRVVSSRHLSHFFLSVSYLIQSYVSSQRCLALPCASVSSAADADHWIRRGVAMFLEAPDSAVGSANE